MTARSRMNCEPRWATASTAATIAWQCARGTASPTRRRQTAHSCRAPSLLRHGWPTCSRSTKCAFREMFAGSPIKRIGVKRMIRNCLIAAGNSGDAGAGCISENASRRFRSGNRRSGAVGACSARVFERGDAGRLIGVGARRQRAYRHRSPAARRSCARIKVGVEHASGRENCSLRLVPSRTCKRRTSEMRRQGPRGEADELLQLPGVLRVRGWATCGRGRRRGRDRRKGASGRANDQAAHEV